MWGIAASGEPRSRRRRTGGFACIPGTNGLAAVGQGGIDMLIEENFLSVLDEESRGMLVKLSSLDYFTAQQAVFVLHSEKAAALGQRN